MFEGLDSVIATAGLGCVGTKGRLTCHITSSVLSVFLIFVRSLCFSTVLTVSAINLVDEFRGPKLANLS